MDACLCSGDSFMGTAGEHTALHHLTAWRSTLPMSDSGKPTEQCVKCKISHVVLLRGSAAGFSGPHVYSRNNLKRNEQSAMHAVANLSRLRRWVRCWLRSEPT